VIKDFIKQIELEIPTINLELVARKYKVKMLCDIQYQRMMDDSHCGIYYRALASACKLPQAKRVCELGTFMGGSAIAMSSFAEKVDTYDINTDNAIPSLEDFNITQIKIQPDGYKSIDYTQYSFIHVDIAHAGPEELEIHQILLYQKYSGFVFWDDTSWPSMRKFWEQVNVPKIETNWHGDSGYGVTFYGV
jgi:hypothetical protein